MRIDSKMSLSAKHFTHTVTCRSTYVPIHETEQQWEALSKLPCAMHDQASLEESHPPRYGPKVFCTTCMYMLGTVAIRTHTVPHCLWGTLASEIWCLTRLTVQQRCCCCYCHARETCSTRKCPGPRCHSQHPRHSCCHRLSRPRSEVCLALRLPLTILEIDMQVVRVVAITEVLSAGIFMFTVWMLQSFRLCEINGFAFEYPLST